MHLHELPGEETIEFEVLIETYDRVLVFWVLHIFEMAFDEVWERLYYLANSDFG